MALDVIADVTLDMQHPGINVVHVNQYDSARKVKAQLQNGGVAWSVPSGAYGIVMFKKTDNKGGFYDTTEFNENAVSIDNNDRSIVYAALDVQTMTVSGNVDVQIAFFQSGKKISTFSFSLQVHASPIQNAELESNWIFNILAHEMSEIITDAATISPAVITAWLEAHVSPETGYVIDNTLTVQGAAADAKAVGDRTLIQKGTIASSDNINTYVTAGQYVFSATQGGVPTGWPSNQFGRLIVFGNHESAHTLRVQVVIDYDSNVFFRIAKSSGWEPWVNVNQTAQINTTNSNALIQRTDSIPYDDNINTYVTAGQYVFSATQGGVVPTGWPSNQFGRLIVFGNRLQSHVLRAQMVVDYNNDVYIRIGKSGTGWEPWAAISKQKSSSVIRVRSDGSAQFTNVAAAIRYTMQNRSSIDADHPVVIDVGEGVFSLSLTESYITDESVDPKGLFLVPYVTLRGKGKDKTTIYWYYSGNDDDILSKVSGLNVPYTSGIEDLTLSVKNLRYAVHSDGPVSTELPNTSNEYLNNTKIVCKNVRFEHLGYDSGINPTYRCPAAWGAGSWNASDRDFIGCDFISEEVSGFLSHNRVGLTEPSTFRFKDCTFISKSVSTLVPPSLGAYGSCTIISWGSAIKDSVHFNNCKANKYVGLTVKTDNGNLDAVIDYLVYADNDIPIFESTTNDAHKNNNYISGVCEADFCSNPAGFAAYTPVSRNGFSGVRLYNPADYVHGICLHACAPNGKLVYQIGGYLPLPLLTSGAFAVGAMLGYSNGEWHEDSVNPILKVVSTNVAKII